MKLSYRVKYNNTWKEIGCYTQSGVRQMGLISSQNTSIDRSLFSRDGKSITNTVSFVLTWNGANKELYQEVLDALLNALDNGSDIECQIMDAERTERLFSGKIDLSGITITSAKIPSKIDLKAKDHIADLDKKINANIVYEDYSVNDIVTSLLAEANAYQAKDLVSSIAATKKCKYFVITSDDNTTYRDVIDTLLFEMGGYCLYRNPATDGYEIHKIFKTEEPSHQIHYLVSDSLKTSTGSLKNKGAIVIYPTVSEMANARLYTENINASFTDDGKLEGEIIKPGEFFPRDGEIQATYQSFDSSFLDREYQEKRSRLQNSDIDLLYVKADTFNLNVNPSTGFDQPAVDLIGKPSGTQLYPRKAWTLLRNNTNKDINLLSFDMTGTAVYKSKLNRLNLATGSDNPEEYETSYVFSDEDATAFGEFYKNWLNLKRTTASWSEYQKETSVGDVVVIKHKETDIGQKYVVVEQTIRFVDKANPVYSCIAIALSGYKEYTGYVDTLLDKKKNPTLESSSEQYYYSTSKTELKGGAWLSEPDNDNTNLLWKRTKYTYTNGNITYSAAYYAGGQDGAPGPTTFSLVLYQRKASAPDKPTGNVTYNIKSGAVSGAGSWTKDFPNGSDPCWVISATASTYTDSDEITPSEWSSVQKLVENGKNGEDGKGLRIISDRTFLRYRENNTSYGDVANLTLQTNLDASKAVWSVDGVAILASDSIVIDSSYFVREWESSPTSSTARMRCIYQADGYLLIGGVSGALVVSKDNGKTWATVSKFASNAITGITSKNGTFVAVDGDGKIYSTNDPEGTWNLVFESGKIFNAVVCDGSVFVAVGETYPGTTGIISKSTDGINWTTITTDCPNLYAICHDGKAFVAIGAGGTAWKSEDGTTWRVAGSTGFDCRGISFNSGKYIAGGAGGQIAYSYNGDTWYRGTVTRTSTATVSHIRAITSAYGEYYSVCYLSNGYGEIWKSNNGIDWSVCYEPLAANTRIWAVAFIGTGILASGDNGNTYYLELPRSISVEVACEGLSDRTAIYIQQDAAAGAHGDNGKDAKLLSINCTPSAFSVSSRGVTQQEALINVSIVKNNLSGAVSWQVFFDTDLEMEGTGESFDIMLPAKVEVARIVIIATCEDHTETLALGAVQNGSAMPMKVADGVWNTTISPLQTRTNGNEPLILGDYILATNGNEELVTYIWNGIQWTVAEGDFRNYSQAMLGVLDDALASEYAIPSSSVLFQYVKHLSAKNAVIRNLFANKIKIEEGGAIYSGAYDEKGEKQGTSEGFHLSEKGKLKAEQAELRNADITGVFECKLDSSEIIFKTQKGATGAPVPCSAKSRWCMADLFNAIAYGASGTGTYNGTSYSYRKCSVANPWQVYTINVSDSSIWGKEVVAFRTNSAVTISYSVAGKTVTGAWRETYIKQYSSSNTEKFSRKASRDNETATGTLSLSAGDYITLRAEGSGSYVSANASISVIDDAIVLHSSNIPSLLLKNEIKYYESLTASFGSFNSANSKNYAPITGWFNGFNNNEVATINSSSVSVNGASYTVVGASKTASNLTLHTSTGVGLSFNGPADTAEGATTGWFNISGTLQKVSETKGVVTNNLIPVNNNISIGTANNPYASVFSTLVQADNITADGTINITGSGTINGPLVYNACFN